MGKLVIGLGAIAVMLLLSGCTSNGSLSSPLNPPHSNSHNYKSKATVKFYRSSDHFGVLQMSDYYISIDSKGTKKHTFSKKKNTVIVNRNNFMIKRLKQGIYTFSLGMGAMAQQTAYLEAGKTYYLAVTFSPGGLAGLAFRSKDEFKKETKDDAEIKLTGEYSSWSGYKYQTVR